MFLCLALVTAGCGPQWKKKFVRKRKNVEGPQAVLVLEPDVRATHPPAVRYQEHFAYWKSWHSELLNSYGENRKRDLRHLVGMISELRAMAEVASGPPAEHLRRILVELGDLEDSWERSQGGWPPSANIRVRLERLEREIDKELHYSKVKKWIGTPGAN
ncbi:MAG: hypothetical protein HYZ93_01765 [Candidatus Omnitrophica bacterium]|nr:hypothetical protein [Candidatus Omnitrophota bacterium]